MGYSFGRDDVVFLGSAAGVAALAEVDRLELTPATHLHDLERVRREFGARSGALVETVRLRRRAAAKLVDPGWWLFTDDALQQATPTLVARHRADRLSGRTVHDVTCSIGAELIELARVCPSVLGSDLDDVRLSMAAHNLAESRNVLLAKADALVPCSTGTVVIADPARRADGRRTHDPAKLQPPLPDLLAAYPGRDLAVKCAPGLDFDRLDWSGEIEIVSLDGAVREACLWSAGLSEPGVTRRATVLTSRGGSVAYTDADPDEIPDQPPGEWLIDPDGAIVRAGLVRHYAAKHGLWQLDPNIAYLTGNSVPDGVRGFRIVDRLELREKTLRRELARRDCGSLEILIRGLDIDPDTLRKRLKLRGTNPYTLVLTRISRTAAAFLCTT
ncbi:class I SAM-dependent methyltransferase [Nocardia sp. NBC_00565]|uniref:THUMP-like domain-containing protein n=1 Tax=Nocardia sp. NBC_00565 TaxID=2975993 RepID=UPI002E81E6B8|nr:class I SAM-dependent methyltransferase [Nocardia sp. NBC_00565]WUC00188.1 class I SAM-dependent methyltransferase [Nocardia sp. NBC_00565]